MHVHLPYFWMVFFLQKTYLDLTLRVLQHSQTRRYLLLNILYPLCMTNDQLHHCFSITSDIEQFYMDVLRRSIYFVVSGSVIGMLQVFLRHNNIRLNASALIHFIATLKGRNNPVFQWKLSKFPYQFFTCNTLVYEALLEIYSRPCVVGFRLFP